MTSTISQPLQSQHPWQTLIFPAATAAGLEIYHALRDCKEVVLHGADTAPATTADFYYHHRHSLPSLQDPDCLRALQQLVTAHKIDAIFPACADTALWLAENAVHIPTAIIGMPLATLQFCRAKAQLEWGLTFTAPNTPPAADYTIDCFSQSDHKVLFAAARTTTTANRTQSVTLPLAHAWAEKITQHLALNGAWSFRLKAAASGKLHLHTIFPFITSSMACTRATGPNFPLLSLYAAAGVTLAVEAFTADLVMTQSLALRFLYDQPIGALYLDLDGTLIVRDAINPRLIALLFQCRNRGIPVHLITRHPGDLPTTLARYRLQNLFDTITHITDLTIPKAHYITEANAVLIDDSFQERRDARQQRGIRCFDAAAAVCLLDERV